MQHNELNQLDLAFVVDTTGSMGTLIAAAQDQMIAMIDALRELFDSCAENGTVSFDYDTRIFAGHLA